MPQFLVTGTGSFLVKNYIFQSIRFYQKGQCIGPSDIYYSEAENLISWSQ